MGYKIFILIFVIFNIFNRRNNNPRAIDKVTETKNQMKQYQTILRILFAKYILSSQVLEIKYNHHLDIQLREGEASII